MKSTWTRTGFSAKNLFGLVITIFTLFCLEVSANNAIFNLEKNIAGLNPETNASGFADLFRYSKEPPFVAPPMGENIDSCHGYKDELGYYHSVTLPPVANDVMANTGSPQVLNALGTNIKWYSDKFFAHLIDTGQSLVNHITVPGNYEFYVTQTITGCESGWQIVRLAVSPPPPAVTDADACVGKPVQLMVSGSNVKWFDDVFNPTDRIYDARNGEVYETRKILSPTCCYFEIWATRNLNYYTPQGSSYYNNDSVQYAQTHGRLYNFQTAKNVCPAGWNLPAGFGELVRYAGYEDRAGFNLKEAGTEHWKNPNTPGTDCCGFKALPAGMIRDGVSVGVGELTGFWGNSNSLVITNSDSIEYRQNTGTISQSVRCMKSGNFDFLNIPVDTGNVFTRTFYAPGTYKFYVSYTTNGFESARATVNITVTDTLPPPPVSDISAVVGQPIPQFVTPGVNLKWYSDKELTHFVGTGNNYQPKDSVVGKHDYYVTESRACEGKAARAILTIQPLPPVAEYVSVCEGHGNPVLTATGSNIKWYRDPLNYQDTITDKRDGQSYRVKQIGGQKWMAQNLNYYTPTGSDYYQHDSLKYAETYGRLYNQNTALKVCPSGWKLPALSEWKSLVNYFGGEVYAAADMKEKGTKHWISPETQGSDKYGFTALPAGMIKDTSSSGLGTNTSFWSSQVNVNNEDIVNSYTVFSSDLSGFNLFSNEYFLSVRCNRILAPDFIGSGNSFPVNSTRPGKYVFYATQTVSDVESDFDTVIVVIKAKPLPPQSDSKNIEYGLPVPVLTAVGSNIKWYKNKDLSVLAGTGNTFKPADKAIGKYYYYVTQTAECESNPDTVALTIQPVRPLAINVTACKNSTIPDLIAFGFDVKWYSNPGLSNLLHSGTKYSTGNTEPGTYTYYVTQTINGIESNASITKLTILAASLMPVASSISVCEGSAVPNLTARGSGIKWYADSTLTMLLHKGDSYATGKTQAGIYHYYVTQSSSDCESNARAVDLFIRKSPELYFGKDTSILYNGSITLHAGNNFQSYEWFNGSNQSSVSISGTQLGMGPHAVWLKVADAYGCSSADTILVTVMVQTSAGIEGEATDVFVYPNPNNGTVYIKFLGKQSNHVNISVLDQGGKLLLQYTKEHAEADEVYPVDLSSLSSGTYIIRVTRDELSKFEKIIKID